MKNVHSIASFSVGANYTLLYTCHILYGSASARKKH